MDFFDPLTHYNFLLWLDIGAPFTVKGIPLLDTVAKAVEKYERATHTGSAQLSKK